MRTCALESVKICACINMYARDNLHARICQIAFANICGTKNARVAPYVPF